MNKPNNKMATNNLGVGQSDNIAEEDEPMDPDNNFEGNPPLSNNIEEPPLSINPPRNSKNAGNKEMEQGKNILKVPFRPRPNPNQRPRRQTNFNNFRRYPPRPDIGYEYDDDEISDRRRYRGPSRPYRREEFYEEDYPRRRFYR